MRSVVHGTVEFCGFFFQYTIKTYWNTLEPHCEVVIILAGNCSKTKQPQNHGVFHSVFRTSIASVLHVLELVTTQPPAFVAKLGKIAGALQLCCNLRSSLSSKLGFKGAQSRGFRTFFVKTVLKLSVANFIHAQHCV